MSIAKIISTGIYDEIPLNGSVSPKRAVTLSPLVDGAIKSISVSEAQLVSAGDVIMELDPTLAQIELDQVRAELNVMKVQHKESIRLRDEVIGLHEKKAVADTAVAQAESNVVLHAARVQSINVQLKRAQELLNQHKVSAPFSGVIVKKSVELGSSVDTNTELVELIEIDTLKVEVAVPQTYFSAVTPGTPVNIVFDSISQKDIQASVTTRIPLADSSARTFPIHIEFQNDDQLIAPGMSARVTLQINHSEETLVVPNDALVRDSDGNQSIWLARVKDGVSTGINIPVQVGRNLQDWVEVFGEFDAGESVVVHGNESLTTDQSLLITEEIKP